MKKFFPLVLLALALTGCNANKDLMPFLGKWKGRFDVSSVHGGSASPADLKRETLYGYVQVYATKRSYKMELNGEQETIDITGTWTHKGNRLTLHPTLMEIDDKGGEQLRDPNKKFIPVLDVRAAYGQPMIFVETSDKKSLNGLEMSVGRLIGTHRLVKDSF